MKRSPYREISRLYKLPWDRPYAYAKLLTDPLYPAVGQRLLSHRGKCTPLLDIGCGQGLFAFYLRRVGFEGAIHGIDYDERKITKAQAIARRHFREVCFETRDAKLGLPEMTGHVTILDILQYLDEVGQVRLLREASERVQPGGMLVIRTGVRNASWRYALTRSCDRMAKHLAWMKGGPVCYPDGKETEGILKESGLEGKFEPLWGKTPFNNYLGVFYKGCSQAD